MIKKYHLLPALRVFELFRCFFIIAVHSGFLFLVYHVLLTTRFFIIFFFLLSFELSAFGYSLYFLLRVARIRLEVSDKGISFYSYRYTISTSWDNVERLGKRVVGIYFPVEGLVLRNPSAIKPSLIEKYTSLLNSPMYETDYSRSIPLQGLWTWNWRKSELAEDLKHYLPHLF